MSLPVDFKNSQDYFEQCLDFLEKYSWIYESSNTCLLKDNIFEKIPTEWCEYFTSISNADLNLFPARQLKTTTHSSLNEFIQKLDKLTPHSEQLLLPSRDYKFKKMSPKKQHEISKLSCLIQRICADGIDILIDFGSGLGYLSELLHRESSYKIIGIESDAERVQASKDRQTKTYPDSKQNVVFKEHYVTNESEQFISDQVKPLAPPLQNPRLAIIGLHSCADLTINSMKLFFKMKNVKKLIIMPCCYHKLEMTNDSKKNGFKNFPLSCALKKATSMKESFNSFNRPFLRLACQQTSARWKNLSENEHYKHSINMFLRGLGEAVLSDEEMIVKSKHKKAMEGLPVDFEEFTSIYEMQSKTTAVKLAWTSEHCSRFSKLLQKYRNGPQLAEGLTCLQTSMQELCENIVLYDRKCFMEEEAALHNLDVSIRFEKIMDEVLSPRCFVLIAQKNTTT